MCIWRIWDMVNHVSCKCRTTLEPNVQCPSWNVKASISNWYACVPAHVLYLQDDESCWTNAVRQRPRGCTEPFLTTVPFLFPFPVYLLTLSLILIFLHISLTRKNGVLYIALLYSTLYFALFYSVFLYFVLFWIVLTVVHGIVLSLCPT